LILDTTTAPVEQSATQLLDYIKRHFALGTR
jgi:hypothetical protein